MSDNKPKFIQAEKFIGLKLPTTSTSITDHDSILYALSIGFNQDPLKKQDFKYTYQFDDEFTVFPTIGVVMTKSDLLAALSTSQNVPNFSPFNILHAEQKFMMVKEKIELNVDYEHELQVVDCYDKGKNAFVLYRVSSFAKNQKGVKELAFTNQILLFIKGLGGFNYKGKGQVTVIPARPKRQPDYVLNGQTFPSQAFIYRLNADRNPLHVDPNISSAQNFQRPIIHGLASFGTVSRVIVQQIFKNDETRFKAIHTRFTGHVFPGEALVVKVWRQNNQYLFEALTKERGTLAVIGYVEERKGASL